MLGKMIPRVHKNILFAYLSNRNVVNKIFSKFEERFISYQNKKFSKIELNRDQALVKLNEILCKLYGQSYSEKRGMWSEHLILFSALSNIENPPNSILEIGTFTGDTTRVLSALFPHSRILTMDLGPGEILNSQLYQYETKNKKLFNKREDNLKNLHNVNFVEDNSLNLIDLNDKFDLIWIDGDHSYPIAPIDIANCIRLLSEKGLAVCDDVYLRANNKFDNGRSTASIDSLRSFTSAGIIEFELLLKRVGFFSNYPASNKKYLGIVKRKFRKSNLKFGMKGV
jgi:predicted O-methyltransferase YrrM